MSTMKRVLELRSDSSGDLLQLLNSATHVLRSNEINRVDLNEAVRLLESLGIDILASWYRWRTRLRPEHL